MAVTDAVLQQVATRVTAGGECAMLEIEQHGGLPLGIRPLDADLPWTVRGRRLARKSPPKLTRNGVRVARREQLVSAVNRILLADAAEIQFHSRPAITAAAGPTAAFQSRQRQERSTSAAAGNPVRAIEPPGAAQHAGGDIEEPLTEIEALARKIEQRRPFPRPLRWSVPRFAMDPGGDTVISVAAVFLLDAPGLLRRDRADRKRRLAGSSKGPAPRKDWPWR